MKILPIRKIRGPNW